MGFVVKLGDLKMSVGILRELSQPGARRTDPLPEFALKRTKRNKRSRLLPLSRPF